MNYQMLKTLLDSLLANFRCPNCSSWVVENNIEIVWAAGTSINLDIMCQSCEKHTFVKAEVSQINLWNIVDFKSENAEELKQKLHQKLTHLNIQNRKIWETKNIEAQINEKEILELREILKNDHINVEDIFGGN